MSAPMLTQPFGTLNGGASGPDAVRGAATDRQRKEDLRLQLYNERKSYIAHWRNISDYILPRRARYLMDNPDPKGGLMNTKIEDISPGLAVRTARSGMLSGLTSPSRPWFRLGTPDPQLSEFGPVKQWLSIVERNMYDVFSRTNLYSALSSSYMELLVWGNGPIGMEYDPDRIVRFSPFTIGTYMLGGDDRGTVDTIVRDRRMTAYQMARAFGEDALSTGVRNALRNTPHSSRFDVVHVIERNDGYDPERTDAAAMRYSSCWYERNSREREYLRESGFPFFPVATPAWERTGEDIYASDCPGMLAYGEMASLMFQQAAKTEALDKQVRPPMKAPKSLEGQDASIRSNDITYLDEMTARFEPLLVINPPYNELREDIQLRQRLISRAFFEDLFLMLAQLDTRRDITAREIQERHEEKLLQLGPVLESLHEDLLDKVIDGTFDFMLLHGQLGNPPLIPPPPRELSGVKLKVEYISVLAQAQRAAGATSIERIVGYVGNVKAMRPDAIEDPFDKLDIDQSIDILNDIWTLPANLVRPDGEVAEIRAARIEAMQAQQQAAQQAAQADVRKVNAEADATEDAVL